MLEIGCGRGEVCRALNKWFDCDVVGVDISSYENWEQDQRGIKFIKADISRENQLELGTFDLIYSNSVWEHVRHPYGMLQRAFSVLKPGGHMLLAANLYRGPKASHRYREIFFPFPHLLFSDEVIDQFYRLHLKKSPGGRPVNPIDLTNSDDANRPLWGSSWVNQLSIADYFNYFNLVGFQVLEQRNSRTPLDESFLKRFADKLDRFPRYDLERDFIHVKLFKPFSVDSSGETGGSPPQILENKIKYSRIERWRKRIFR